MSLPEFKVTIGDNDTTITLNGRRVASAWGPAADGTGEWFAYRYGENPLRSGSENAARAHSASVVNLPLPAWATKPQLPVVGDSPEPAGQHGYTRHGHPCCGNAPVERPESVARCGGTGLCTLCALQATKMHTGSL